MYERIVCLTEETVETLYLLGEDRRIVGVSGYAVRPPRVRKEKPRVSAFISADMPKILALEPDLVLDLLRSAGRHRRRTDPRRHRGACLQPARPCRHLRDDRDARRAGRRERTRQTALARSLQEKLDCVQSIAQRSSAQAARLFRGMGRADDFRHPLGVGTDRDRRRRRRFSRTVQNEIRDRTHRHAGRR